MRAIMEPGRVEHLTKAEIGYLAGMVDFCGTFYISEEVKNEVIPVLC